MARFGCFIIGWLLLAATPAVAQNLDVFREATPPPPASAPPPPPRPVPEPEQQVVVPAPPPQPAVAPVPNLPSAAQIWARVRQIAASESIAVPLAGAPLFDQAGTPSQYRALLGAWGPGTWQGGDPAGEKIVLVIQSIDGDGNVRGVIGSTSATTGWKNFTAPIANGRFTLHFQLTYSGGGTAPGVHNLGEVSWEIAVGSDGTLRGSRNNNASTVVLPRLQ